ncbi:MAG: glycogen debranching protein [Succinivibrionaceae bacterium]
MSAKHKVSMGDSRHLGASVSNDGVNFAIYCSQAEVMELLLFKDTEDTEPEVIELDPEYNRNIYYWHIFVHGIKDGQLYGWRVKSVNKFASHKSLVDTQKVLLDPYGLRIVFPKNYNRTFNQFVGSNTHFCAKNVVIDISKYDWENDKQPKRHLSTNVIYEMHVAGFTKDQSSGLPDEIRGTYKGVIEKIPYLLELGINTVELLPVFQFDKFDASPGKSNYWGYAPMCFFAIHGDYSSKKDLYGPLDEFRDMVKAFHKAGIEVILDVVYNHTSEGDEHGPIYSFKGLANDEYYLVDDDGSYRNYSGCGNTLNASNPIVKRMIIDSLVFWTDYMHVDGFRFDLACVLSRDIHGKPLNDPPTTLSIAFNYKLSNVKLIAEPWDAVGMYQVGSMAGAKWREWNGQFRDDMRCFIRGDDGKIQKFVNRLIGSPDIYNPYLSDSLKGINFITCHDGFTLWDLVSYNQKHNLDNGENNRDGSDMNFSSNYGIEGPTNDKNINAIRLRQAKNFMLLNLFSLGVPMILMGDEVLRTQWGNNNAYCQDSYISYQKWNHTPMQEDMLRFTKELLKIRTKRGSNYLCRLTSLDDAIRKNRIVWHGIEPNKPDWSNTSHTIAFTKYSESLDCYFYVFVNSYWEGLHIKIPDIPCAKDEGKYYKWKRLIDTSQKSPLDITLDPKEQIEIGHNYYLDSRSILVLIYKDEAKTKKSRKLKS